MPRSTDALVQLLVADALAHDLDAPPWLRQANVQEALRDLKVPFTAPDRAHR